MTDDIVIPEHMSYETALALFGRKEYTGAARLFERLHASEPANQEVSLLLGRSYYHSAQLGRAVDHLQGHVDRWQDDAYALLVLGRALQRAGRTEEARGPLRLAEAMGQEV